jgi:hypothetical protein
MKIIDWFLTVLVTFYNGCTTYIIEDPGRWIWWPAHNPLTRLLKIITVVPLLLLWFLAAFLTTVFFFVIVEGLCWILTGEDSFALTIKYNKYRKSNE